MSIIPKSWVMKFFLLEPWFYTDENIEEKAEGLPDTTIFYKVIVIKTKY